MAGELHFENELVEYLQRIGGVKQWKYEPSIKTTDELWENFRRILQQNNQERLDGPLSDTEFNQVKKIINNIHTPYQAGQFLYGLNGKSEIEIDTDSGRHVYLIVFDQKQVGAGNTVYQIVNQIERDPVQAGRPRRRFDVTLLINGLPIIQIEEKSDTNDVNEALNQMNQYIDEQQYRDIYSTLQILVAITPNDVRYMANTTAGMFNKNFAFKWQDKDTNKPVRDWKTFANSMLSIPMAHQMATNYMILDGTKNKQMLKVMRPYQVYATRRVIEEIKKHDFSYAGKNNENNKIGYVWHTTGSGKTISSFKAAWLASKLPNVDKVVFVVDRIALTSQTADNYRAYDPENETGNSEINGVVSDTANVGALRRQLKSDANGIIVTSVQKLGILAKNERYQAPDKNIVFIVDEAHRSTAGDNFHKIQNKFKRAAWVGYTGTPMFDDTTKGLRTEDIFGQPLHTYTIREAIADGNVLGFKVDFQTTISQEQMENEYLPAFYSERYPEWTEAQIKTKIAHLTPEDIDDSIEPSFYDNNDQHIKLVVEDIFKNWRNRSNDGMYNALFTTHVGGGKASTPMAMKYYREFKRVNSLRAIEGQPTLKVGITFSANTSNSDTMIATNDDLIEAINDYNDTFDKSFGLDDVTGYTADVTSRLNRTADDGQFLDIVIVVDQLLTGFDAPQMNTLYVDRTLHDAGLIQAYSRTNRIENRETKPFGRIVNYRWPVQNEALMNKALAIYANKDSARLSEDEQRDRNTGDGVLAKPFEDQLTDVKKTVSKLRDLTDDFVQISPSEAKQEETYKLMREYNAGIAKLKQYDPQSDGEGFDYDEPEELVKAVGMSPDEEKTLTHALANELKEKIAKIRHVSQLELDLRMEHIKDVEVNYDYLDELVSDLMNQVNEEEHVKVLSTKNQILDFAKSMDDRVMAKKITTFIEQAISGDLIADNYPVSPDESSALIDRAHQRSIDHQLQDFRVKWGIVDDIKGSEMSSWLLTHAEGADDLDRSGQLSTLLRDGSEHYKTLADSEVASLSKIKYRNQLREAIKTLADQLNEV
ncbi:type I restriction endonuclease subunit R [Furfurilactobacillus milii]|uniref:Type I restriction enzyme endonuclease subunit n=1 Tax=Furfurilactobacillus milii TaxID=2888272 RepID=A0A6N9I4C1_9LACO|nr:HsdR family type I site-specific deoxyribonuclease [Furfurilactobacillus milii]MYV17554.1 HsdR family type I site-specific deoxyribonuclease [Furfurilactobacillus milii]